MSSAPVLYNHRIYCNVEARFVSIWTETATLITTCPTDPAHSVLAGSASLLDTVSTGIVVINKEPGATTGGYVRVDALTLTASGLGNVTVTKSWPIDIAIYVFKIIVPSAAVGCTLTLEAAPLTTVGTLAADATIGSTTVTVSPSATANIFLGLVLTLQQGGTIQEVGRVTAINTTTNQVSFETATTSLFQAAGPTAVKVTARAAEALPLPFAGETSFGETRAKVLPWPKNRVISARLNNPNLGSATVTVYIAYNY